jgi:sugar O-acyltransferase (sialic acid O-acetyltransferase NeuD family)
MDHTKLIFLGGGGHAKVVLDSARGLGLGVDGFHDDDPAPSLCGDGGLAHLGKIPQSCSQTGTMYMVTVGELGVRERLIMRIERSNVGGAVVDRSAVVSPSAQINGGVFVGVGAIVNADAVVGAHAIINTGAIVEHDCRVGLNTHLAPRVVLGGGVVVGEHTLVGIGSTVLPGVTIGSRCVIGGGAVVIDDVADGQCVVGNPARPIGVAAEGRVRF